MFIPYQAVMIPLAQIFIDVGFPDGIPRLVFAHIVYGIPITTLIFRSYYATIPEDLIEAARMDRAGMLRTYWSVVLPISAPAFVVTAIWQFTSIWNDFLFAVFLITDPSSWPVTVALNNTTGSLVTPYNVQMAAALHRVAPDADRLHPARPLLHARPDGRGAEGLGSTGMADIKLDKLGKRFPNGFWAVKDLSLEIAEAELLVLVGPSGCGKTTALRMIAGLEDISEGDLYISGTRVNDVLERDRDIAMVFQNYALYPHMTVAQNIAFSLRLQRRPKKEIKQRVQETAKLLGLEELLDRKPKQLSGGQQQRVAMGRAIIRQPQVFLMDEPLSNLDAQLRVHMRGEIEALQKRLGVTTVYVTHDQVEAMTMGDRVAVLRAGELQQVDTPTNVYDRPANLFVAGFIGSPPMNLARGTIEPSESSGLVARLGSATIPIPDEHVPRARARGLARPRGHRRHPPRGPRRTVGGWPAARRCHHGGHDRPRRGARLGAPLLLHRRRGTGDERGHRRGHGRRPRGGRAHHARRHAVLRDLRAAIGDPCRRHGRGHRRRPALALLRSRDRAGHRDVAPSLRSLPAGRARAG